MSKQLTPSSQESTNARPGPYDAGDELLEYWQVQWEAIHMAQDQVQIQWKILTCYLTVKWLNEWSNKEQTQFEKPSYLKLIEMLQVEKLYFELVGETLDQSNSIT